MRAAPARLLTVASLEAGCRHSASIAAGPPPWWLLCVLRVGGLWAEQAAQLSVGLQTLPTCVHILYCMFSTVEGFFSSSSWSVKPSAELLCVRVFVFSFGATLHTLAFKLSVRQPLSTLQGQGSS